MKYQIYVRKIEEKDLSLECPYFYPDEEEYQEYLSSLVENININSKVIEATENNNIITIVSELKRQELIDSLKSVFDAEKCVIKTVDMKEIV